MRPAKEISLVAAAFLMIKAATRPAEPCYGQADRTVACSAMRNMWY